MSRYQGILNIDRETLNKKGKIPQHRLEVGHLSRLRLKAWHFPERDLSHYHEKYEKRKSTQPDDNVESCGDKFGRFKENSLALKSFSGLPHKERWKHWKI